MSDYSAAVDWGDGSQTAPSVTFVSGPDQNNLCNYRLKDSPTYAEEGHDKLSVSVTGPNSGTPGQGTGQGTVADAALIATSPGPRTAVAGTQFSGAVATFSDADPADAGGSTTSTSFTATVSAATTTTTTTTTPGPTPGPFPISIVPPAVPVRAGALLRLSAQATPPPGTHVVAYHWSLLGPGRFDIDTGSTPSLDHRFTAGRHQVWVQAVGSNGTDSTRSTFTVSAAAAVANRCISDITLGWIEVTTPGCVQVTHPAGLGSHVAGAARAPVHSNYSVAITNAGISLNGLEVQCPISDCVMTITPTTNLVNPRFGSGLSPYSLTTNKPVRLVMPNSTNGPVDLGEVQLNFTWAGKASGGAPELPFHPCSPPKGACISTSPAATQRRWSSAFTLRSW